MTNNQRACEFEALICEVQALAIDTEAMKVANKEREGAGYSLAYGEESFNAISEKLKEYATKFRELGKK